MYWMVGCPPGGSAGTSFCSGTEISISRLAMGISSKISVVAAILSARPAPCRCRSDRLDARLGDDVAPFRHFILDSLAHAVRPIGENLEPVVAKLLGDRWRLENPDRTGREQRN